MHPLFLCVCARWGDLWAMLTHRGLPGLGLNHQPGFHRHAKNSLAPLQFIFQALSPPPCNLWRVLGPSPRARCCLAEVQESSLIIQHQASRRLLTFKIL